MASENNDLRNRVSDFMMGRNGSDELSVTIVMLAVVLAIINAFGRWLPLTVIVLALLGYALFRLVSKDISARRKENDAFCDLIGPARPWLRDPKAAWAESRQYKHAVCPNCHQRVRIPRGKGHVRVTCPQCRQKFDVRA